MFYSQLLSLIQMIEFINMWGKNLKNMLLRLLRFELLVVDVSHDSTCL